MGIYNLEDLTTPGLWEEANCVLHTAWSTVPMLSERNVATEWMNDLPLLVQILRAVAEKKNPPHFIFFSSGGTVYGNAPGRPSVEDDLLKPVGWHGFAKVQAEELIRQFCSISNIPFTILRISNPYGYAAPSEKPQGIIPILIKSALEEQPFKIWGTGDARKDYIHSIDLIEGIRGIVAGRATGVFNLCSGESYSVREIIAQVEKRVGRPIATDRIPGFEWDVSDSRLSNERLRQAIGWRPTISLEDGLSRSVELLSKGSQ